MIKILKNPICVLFSIMLAIATSVMLPGLGKYAELPSKIYLSLLQMAITPLVFITITLSITNIFRNILYINIVKKSIIYFIIVSILFVFIAILISVIENFGSIVASKKDIKEIIDANFSNIIDVNENASLNLEAHIGIKKFLQDLVPSNIFSAFANGRVEQLVIFSIFLGAAMGTISRKYTEESTYHISLEKINISLKKIVEWILMLLPIGIFFIISNQFSSISWKIIISLLEFVVTISSLFIILSLCGIIFLSIKSKTGLFHTINQLNNSIVIAFTTGSPFATLSSLTETMAHDLHFDKKGLDLILPLGLSIFRFGNLIYFACIIIFLSQMYDVPLNFADYIFIILGSMIAASAAAATGIINLKLISIMAIPLGIPIELGLILFASIDAFIDPFRTLCTVFVNAATAAISVDVNLNENNEV